MNTMDLTGKNKNDGLQVTLSYSEEVVNNEAVSNIYMNFIYSIIKVIRIRDNQIKGHLI